MNKVCYNIAIALLLSTTTVSCIRDDLKECPPMRLTIEVKDKNYFNVDATDLENRKKEDLPFRDYVPTLHYSVSDLNTGEVVVHSGLVQVTGTDTVYTIDLPQELDFGTYSVQVWGGMADLDPLEDDHNTIAFHPKHAQGRDIYLTSDTVVYSPTCFNDIIQLERTKGKLIIQLENLPEGMEYSHKVIGGLYAGVNQDFTYTDATYVQTDSHWSGDHTVTKTYLTPTIEDMDSYLTMVIHDGSFLDDNVENNILVPASVPITINRNELAVVRYVWNQYKKDFDIFVLIDDNWERVHGMQIEE